MLSIWAWPLFCRCVFSICLSSGGICTLPAISRLLQLSTSLCPFVFETGGKFISLQSVIIMQCLWSPILEVVLGKKKRGRHGIGEGGRSCWVVESTWSINPACNFSTGITSSWTLSSVWRLKVKRNQWSPFIWRENGEFYGEGLHGHVTYWIL